MADGYFGFERGCTCSTHDGRSGHDGVGKIWAVCGVVWRFAVATKCGGANWLSASRPALLSVSVLRL